MKRWFSGLILMVFLLLCLGTALADPNFSLQDTSVRSGSWTDVYAAILTEQSPRIRAYQDYVASVTSSTVCHPVGLTDLTGDGIPELLFLELADDSEYGFQVGQLRIYTWDGGNVHCALTLQPEIDDLMYSKCYSAKHGLLTLHFSDCEMTWTLQLCLDPGGHYVTENVLIEQPDFSGESPDLYFLNGKKLSQKKYQSQYAKIQSAQGSLVGSMDVDNGGTGFAWTLEEALNLLSSGGVLQNMPENGMSQLPELSFFRGSFTAGQKFAVYSAPSSRSWRGANGKAAITSGSEIYVAGTEDGWILILYELGNGVVRAGYVDSRQIEGPYSSVDVLSLSGTPMTLVKSAEMTDDPIRQNETVGKLKKGAQVTCLARFRGWIYVEAKVSGKIARGFIEPSSLGWDN